MSHDSYQDFALAFLGIFFEGAPFILVGTLISGLLDVYLPAGWMERVLPKNKWFGVLVAGMLGAIFPVCECAVVPVIRRLVKKGLPASCALTYMLAAPIVNPITAFSTWKAFEGTIQWQMTLARLSAGFTVAVLVGAITSLIPLRHFLKASLVDALEKSQMDRISAAEIGETKLNHDLKLVQALRSAQQDLVGVGVYFCIGVVITAIFNVGIAPGAEWLDSIAQQKWLAPGVLMLLAFFLSLCSTSDAFIAATLDQFRWSAKLAFLTYGPMMDLKLIFLYQSVMRKRVVIGLAVGLFLVIGIIAILSELWWWK